MFSIYVYVGAAQLLCERPRRTATQVKKTPLCISTCRCTGVGGFSPTKVHSLQLPSTAKRKLRNVYTVQFCLYLGNGFMIVSIFCRLCKTCPEQLLLKKIFRISILKAVLGVWSINVLILDQLTHCSSLH
jgi:hypothetical protein